MRADDYELTVHHHPIVRMHEQSVMIREPHLMNTPTVLWGQENKQTIDTVWKKS